LERAAASVARRQGMRERRIDGCRQSTRNSGKIENEIIQVLGNDGMTFFDKMILL
jgi:hypothetical protein